MKGRIEMVFTEENGNTKMDTKVELRNASKADMCRTVFELNKGLGLTKKDWSAFKLFDLRRIMNE